MNDAAAQVERANLTIRADRLGPRIDPNLHGQFAEHLGRGIYDGLWVGPDSPIRNVRGLRADAVDALRRLAIPVLRWPGGCFADEYHWRDGVGPADRRPRTINGSWGGVVETNAFGSHEFLDLCELVGAAPYLNGNVASGSPSELADWLEYLTSDTDSRLAELRRRNGRAAPWRIPFVGFGNEPWGCGGHMRAEQYADEYRRFAAFVRGTPANPVCRIGAGGHGGDVAWTEQLMERAADDLDAITVHQYTLPTGDWEHKGPATGFDQAAWSATLARSLDMDGVLSRHVAAMDARDPTGRVALIVDEWGAWYDVEQGWPASSLHQQNTVRDALVAALTLNVFHAHAARLRMANLAQVANVLQALLLTDGPHVVLTPTYHVFDLYQPFRGACVVPVEAEVASDRIGDATLPLVHTTAAVDGSGRLWLALVNPHPTVAADVSIGVVGHPGTRLHGRVLTGPAIDSANRVEAPNAVHPVPISEGPERGGRAATQLPARSVTVVEVCR